MNAVFLGDSYDLVKRFFSHELGSLGYRVVADPMFTGCCDNQYFRLVGVVRRGEGPPARTRTALFLDPDTGVGQKDERRHVSFGRIAREASVYDLVFAFDQSFSRKDKPIEVMEMKLRALHELAIWGMYYDSHARFLFASRHAHELKALRAHLVSLGLPESRLVRLGA